MKNNLYFGTCMIDGSGMGWVFGSRDDLHKQIEINDSTILFETNFVVHGSNYKDKKESARALAIDIQGALSESSVSWWEHSLITKKLYSIGKRFGLIKEFKENAII